MTFHTLAVSTDVTAPVVTMVTPTGGTVIGPVTIEATASDNIGVASVASAWMASISPPRDPTAPYTLAWDSTTVADGAHTLTAEARDAANNVGSTSVTVLVQNAPVTTGPHYLEFDGVDDYLSVADAPALSFGTGAADQPLTIEMWLRTEALGKHQLIGKWGESTNQEYKLLIAMGTIRRPARSERRRSGDGVPELAPPMVGSWHHLAVTYDGRGGATAATASPSMSTACRCRCIASTIRRTSRWSRGPRRWRSAGRVRSGVSTTAGSTTSACGTWRARRARSRPPCPRN